MSENLETATFAAGCFWCYEPMFTDLRGVVKVMPGYIGGYVENPSYEQVCTGSTGHAEAFQIKFNPDQIKFSELLDVFWHVHDPTTLNRQGNDVGTQYRSAIFYHSEEQRQQAEASKHQIEESGEFDQPIVTEIVVADNFYPAEDYHQKYYQNHPNQGYCQVIISPKLAKFREKYGQMIA